MRKVNELSFQSPEYTSSLFKMLYDGGSVPTILTKYQMQEARLQNSLPRWGTKGLSPGYSERGWDQSQDGWKVPWSTSVGWGCSYHKLWTQEHHLSNERKSNMKFKEVGHARWDVVSLSPLIEIIYVGPIIRNLHGAKPHAMRNCSSKMQTAINRITSGG